MSIYLTGIQPSSGSLHLGNYIGSLLNCKKIIKKLNKGDKFYFMVADLHAMTTIHDKNLLKQNIKNLIATYIACGIEPNENNIFFQQSSVPAHGELCWILSTTTPLGSLERMTQFKDKKSKFTETSSGNINAGLLYYPILMAADILLYKTNYVLVGEDQTQHVELTRDIAQKFISLYNENSIFTIPEKIVDNTGKRIMSLGDGKKKMSKSVGEDKDKIFLSDEDDQIAKKIKCAKTDSITGIYYDKENRPEISNLINIFSVITGRSVEDISNDYREKNTKTFKDDLTQLLIAEIKPIREKRKELLQNSDYLYKILSLGKEAANIEAGNTILKVKEAIGVLTKNIMNK